MLSYKFRVLLLSVLSSQVLAAPWEQSSKHNTHSVRNVARGTSIETYFPESTYETYGEGVDHPVVPNGDSGLEAITLAFLESKLNTDAGSIKYRGGYAGESGKYAYVSQMVNGIPVANAVANVAFNHDNKVAAFGSSFVQIPAGIPTNPTVTLQAAIEAAEQALDGKHNGETPSIEYFVTQGSSSSSGSDTAVLTYAIQVRNIAKGTWFEAFVDAHSGDVVGMTDFVARASYRVLPITKETLLEGTETLVDPQDISASPLGWHDDGVKKTTVTAGNNAIAANLAVLPVSAETAPQSSATNNFVYNQDPAQEPTTPVNMKAAIVNAFYIVNSIHDITYKYGFTESAFNFQTNNFGKGGKGKDRVSVSVQDSDGTDNADFATPPDGQNGEMRMFLWDLTTPGRDGALENDIIAHENTHGLSNRLTGGGTGRCHQTTEASGLGEGWSDAFAEWTEQKSATVPDYVLGAYVTNYPPGIRSHPYSTSKIVNPLRYSSVKTKKEVHDIGEVWANMLHNVYAALVAARGFSDTAHTNPATTEGNVVFLHLFVDQLALQPCNPTFVTARNAWIQADANRYSGANRCTLWRAFASRGLGVNAKNYNDDSSVPSGC